MPALTAQVGGGCVVEQRLAAVPARDHPASESMVSQRRDIARESERDLLGGSSPTPAARDGK
jgi:hypothetical protein